MVNIYATLFIRRNMFLRWMVRKDNFEYDFALFGLGVNEKF